MVCVFWMLQRMIQCEKQHWPCYFVSYWERAGGKGSSRGVMNSPSHRTKGVSPCSSAASRKGCRKSLFWWWIVRWSLHLPTLQRRMFFLHRRYSLLCTGGQVFTAGYHLLPNALYAAGFHQHAGGLPFPQG